MKTKQPEPRITAFVLPEYDAGCAECLFFHAEARVEVRLELVPKKRVVLICCVCGTERLSFARTVTLWE